MNLVAISSLSPKDLGILVPINDRWRFCRVIQPDWTQTTSAVARWSKFRRSPLTTIGRRLQKPYYDRHMKRLDEQITSLCFASSVILSLDAPRSLVPSRELNSDATAAIIRAAEPDVMITSTCPILKRKIFDIPRFGTINIHWGIAPLYRGTDTLFWPLYYGDFENIGVTIHRIDDGIDTGPILAQGFPELQPDDTEATLFAKCATLAAELLETVLMQIETAPTGSSLSTTTHGRLFRERDRTVWHEIVYCARRKMRRRYTPPNRERRTKIAWVSDTVLV